MQRGGSGGSGYKATGVAAGGLIGYEGQYHYYNCDSHNLAVKTPALGGTQTQGGIGMICEGNCMHGISNNGLFGKGANDDNLIGMGSYGSGGGGAGYFGGGSGTTTNCDITSSASGSSFISGHNGCVAITEDSTESNIKQRTDLNGNTCTDGTTDITCSYHYSGYKFTDTVMIDGAGYNWTTVKGDYVGQPQPDGTTKEGHSGNGYARITYLGN